MIGSRTMVEGIPDDQVSKYCAMINIDSFGMAAPFALEGSSSRSLSDLAEKISGQMKMPFAKIRMRGADSDSTSFIRKKIPAVTLSGLSADWQSVLHTIRDQEKRVNPNSVYLGYRLALSMWGHLEESNCSAFR